MSNNPFEGKKAKFVKGHIELRSEKSARNLKKALDKKKGMSQGMMDDLKSGNLGGFMRKHYPKD